MNRDLSYFENMFHNYSTKRGNGWGMNWRAYMILRGDLILTYLKKVIEKYDDAHIMEIGCASGDFTERCLAIIESGNAAFLGVDISEKAIDICNNRFSKYNNLHFKQAQLPIISDRNFDIILCMDVLEYFNVEERKEVYGNISNCLNKNGRVLFQTPLDGEEIAALIEGIEEFFVVENVDFLYGWLWFNLFEKRFSGIGGLWLNENKSIIKRLVGLGPYLLLSSKMMVRLFFYLNKVFFPNKKSHIVINAKRK